MAELEKTIAADLTLEEMTQLIGFADCQPWYLTGTKTVQTVLDIYHASKIYIAIEDWLMDDPTAQAIYDRICAADALVPA